MRTLSICAGLGAFHRTPDSTWSASWSSSLEMRSLSYYSRPSFHLLMSCGSSSSQTLIKIMNLPRNWLPFIILSGASSLRWPLSATEILVLKRFWAEWSPCWLHFGAPSSFPSSFTASQTPSTYLKTKRWPSTKSGCLKRQLTQYRQASDSFRQRSNTWSASKKWKSKVKRQITLSRSRSKNLRKLKIKRNNSRWRKRVLRKVRFARRWLLWT